MVQKIDNTSTQYYKFMILLSPRFNDFKNIEYKDGKIYLTLATRTLYEHTLVDLFSSWTPVGPKRPPAAPRAETEKNTTVTIVKSPQIESMNETNINALIIMKIESMQDLQTNNTKQIDIVMTTMTKINPRKLEMNPVITMDTQTQMVGAGLLIHHTPPDSIGPPWRSMPTTSNKMYINLPNDSSMQS